MRRAISVLLVTVVLMVTLTACGNKECKAYTFKCVDASGNPVEGVSLQVCSDTTCMLFKTDENGETVCEDLPEMAYEVHVLKCPDGYSYDLEDGYTTSATFETHTFTLSNE